MQRIYLSTSSTRLATFSCVPRACTCYYIYTRTTRSAPAAATSAEVHTYVLKLGSSSSAYVQMMNNPDAAAAAGPWCCYNDNAGEATAAVPTTGESGSFFADMAADYSIDELFELAWEQEGQACGGASGSMQPEVSCIWSPRLSSKPPDVRSFDPPSEDEMAAWLGAVVKGEELACNDHDDDNGSRRSPTTDDGRDVVPAKGTSSSTSTAMDKKEKIPTTTIQGMMGNKEMRKVPAGGSSRRSHHGEAHNLTEKRRRHKINERLKTLQQLVPGCSKSNQASTLDQTIHYMKSLQHQVEAMSVGLAAPAVYPVVQPQCVPPGKQVAMPFPAAPMVLGGHPPLTTMVSFGTTMLQLPHYPAAAVMVPAAAGMAPLYPAAAAAHTSTAVAPGDAVSAKHLHASSSRSSSKGKGLC